MCLGTVQGMWFEIDLQVEVTGRGVALSRITLSRKPDFLSLANTLGDFDVQGARTRGDMAVRCELRNL